MKEEVFKKIESYREEMIYLQKKLTSFPAISPQSGGEGEWKKAMFLSSFLEEKGFKNIRFYNADDPCVPDKKRPNITLCYEGENTEKSLWIMTHLDVVPPGEGWNTEPFEVVEDKGKLFGRGVEDNQQGLVAGIYSLLAIKELGLKPKFNVGLLFVADEEVGSKFGIDYLLKNHPDIFKKDDIFVVPDAGNPEGTMIEIAEKSILWIKFKTIGKQCHGSMPHLGKNSFKAASFLVTKLHSLYCDFPLNNPLFNPPMSTFEPTKKEKNVDNINSIPGEDIFYLDSRILPEIPLDSVLKTINEYCREIEERFGVEISYEFPQLQEAAPATPSHSPIVVSLKDAIKEIYGKEGKPMGIGGGTVAAFLRRKGFHVAVWEKIDETAHQPNEYCIIDNMVGDSKVFAYLMLF